MTWAIVTEAGNMISERDCIWPSLSEDVRIRELRYRTRTGLVGKIEGFELYGFQRYSVTSPQGDHIAHAGTQLIGVKDDEVTIIDINETQGVITRATMTVSELTYDPTLLRSGVMS